MSGFQALSLAVNREAIASRVMEGLAEPASQITTEGFFGWSPDLGELTYNVDEAKALLAEAGYPEGFKLDLHCTSDRLPMDGDVCAALGPMPARIGIEATVNATPRGLLPGPVRRRVQHDDERLGHAHRRGVLHPELADTKEEDGSYGVLNHFSYGDPEIDALIEEALGALDEDQRRSLLEQAMVLTVNDLMAIPIVNLSAIWAGNTDVATYRPRADEDTVAINADPAM